MEPRRVGRFEAYLFRRHLLGGFDVGVDLEVEAAFELGALPGELLRVEREVLKTGGARGHGDEVGHPFRATQRAAAGAEATDAARFLTRADLFHLDAHLESLGQHLDELAEVNAFVGDIVEDGLVAVALIFDVADFHIEVERRGDFAGANHCVVLAGFGLFEFFEVGGFGLAEHAAHLVLAA